MPDREKVFDALRNCITEPKCKDCPWETCEKFHQTKTIPLDLCLDILELLKEQEETELCDRCGRRRLKSNRSVKCMSDREKVISK